MEAGFLAAEVSKYFEKSGNRFVFRNGMSLNEVAGAMNEYCYESVDPGVLSKVIKKQRQFTTLQADAFCKTIALTFDERLRLHHALAKDVLRRFGLDVALVALPATLEFMICELHRVDEDLSQERITGAITVLCDLFRWVTSTREEAPDSIMLIRIHTLMLVEREKLMQRIAETPKLVNLQMIEVIDQSSVDFVSGMFGSETRLKLLAQITDPSLSLTNLERTIWDSIYRHKRSVTEIAALLFLQPGTVQSIRENIEKRLIAGLLQQLESSTGSA